MTRLGAPVLRALRVVLCGAILAGAPLAALPSQAAGDGGIALPASAVTALGGHLLPWQVEWLESGGASGVPSNGAASPPSPPDPAEASFSIDGQTVALRDGVFHGPLTTGSAYITTIALTDFSATGDIVGDGLPDTAIVLAQTGKGGGTAYYLAALLGGMPAGPAATAALGADLTIQWVATAGPQILVDYLGPASPPAPTLAAFILRDGALVASPAPPATSIATWSPNGFEATAVASGSCWTGSIAAIRAGAYRCTTGSAVSDPCFSSGAPLQVDCPTGDPAAQQGLAIRLSQPLPTGYAAAPNPQQPWRFTLLGGGVCAASTGTLISPDHPYDCALPGASASGSPDVYCTAPSPTVDGPYTSLCAGLSPQPAADGAPQLGPDAGYVVTQLWL